MDLSGLPADLVAERARVLALAKSYRGLLAVDARDVAEVQRVEIQVHTGAPAGRGALMPARLNVLIGEDGRVCKTWVG